MLKSIVDVNNNDIDDDFMGDPAQVFDLTLEKARHVLDATQWEAAMQAEMAPLLYDFLLFSFAEGRICTSLRGCIPHDFHGIKSTKARCRGSSLDIDNFLSMS